jgi:gamma-glutamyltranspeptidase/glutathione hydrolase
MVEPGEAPAGSTTYLTVVDKDGNVVSWIQSIFAHWGSKVTVDGMGFILQNRGAGFSLDPKQPNVLAPGKRPVHTIIPAFMERGDMHIGFGIMGGAVQPLAHAQFVSNMVDFGMNVQAAMEAPRFAKQNADGCNVAFEFRLPPATLQQLSELGHELQLRKEYNQNMGRGQAILHNSKTGTNYAASDPRADGAAVPEPIRP